MTAESPDEMPHIDGRPWATRPEGFWTRRGLTMLQEGRVTYSADWYAYVVTEGKVFTVVGTTP